MTPYFLAHVWLVPLFPLITAGLMLLVGRKLPNKAVSALCVGSVFLSFVFAVGAVLQLLAMPAGERVYQMILFDWVTPGAMQSSFGLTPFVADWGYLLDPLSAVMILVVTGVGFLIHVYSIGYMGHEGGYYRFFGYLNLFMFSMLTLVLANNLLLLFVGWEGVGTCSYLLIGFYFLKKSASDAGKKAFIVNRIGDAGFLLGLFLIAGLFGTIRFTSAGFANGAVLPSIQKALPVLLEHNVIAYGAPVMTLIGILLFVGATGKSAQIPLYVWLPDAMEGPTPVSALIHAATMVTAGVYMVARMNAIYQLAPVAREVIAVIGAATAIYAASIALVQYDIKKVLAYSTISQLGYMFLALGAGAFTGAIFHLMTHAFFKALLFLGAGSVIHALSGEQDLRKMGGLWNRIPKTSRTMLAATLAIAGIPPLAGFFSKDEILGQAFEYHPAFWLVGFVTAGMTAFYMFRLFFLAFKGDSRIPHEAEHHVHESPGTMTVPLMILALLSVIGGWIGWPKVLGGSNHFAEFLAPVFKPVQEVSEHAAEHGFASEYLLMAASVGIALLGIWIAYSIYVKNPKRHEELAERFAGAHKLLENKYYVDEIYDALFVERVKDLSVGLGLLDAKVIDGLGVDGAGWLARFLSKISMWWDKWIVDGTVNFTGRLVRGLSVPVRMFQTGVFSNYAVFILLGLVILLGYYGHHVQQFVRNLR